LTDLVNGFAGMEKIAVFSDVHSNLEALDAVFADMDGVGVGLRVCLGDLVGYGPNPSECLERVRAIGCPIVRGNHDSEVAGDCPPICYRDDVSEGIKFSGGCLDEEQKIFLRSLPFKIRSEDCTFVHASLDDPWKWNYINDRFDAIPTLKKQVTTLCFCGHTHRPGIFKLVGDDDCEEIVARGIASLPGETKCLINVGSVGQPRDLDPRASYAIYCPETHAVEFRRVAYPFEVTQKKMQEMNLPAFHSERLGEGI